MDEVTWLLIGDSAPDGSGGRHELALAEILGEIAHAIAESLRTLGIVGIILQQVSIFLESRAAARGRDDDRVIAGPLEGIDVLAGEYAGLVHHPGMNVERTTTLLLERHVDVGAVSGDDAGRGAVRVGKHGAHDAAVEKTH